MSETKTDFLRMLLLGQAGCGKTRCAITTAPEGGIYVMVADIGNATASAKGRGRDFDESPLIDSAQKFENALKEATKGVAEGRYRTVIFDTISEYSRAILEMELAASPNNTQRAYGDMGRKCLSAVTRMVKNLQAHLIFVAHAAFSEEGETELDVSGQSGRRIPALLSDVWLLRRQGERRLFSRKAAGVLKSRTVPDDVLECDASIVELMKRMKQ